MTSNITMSKIDLNDVIKKMRKRRKFIPSEDAKLRELVGNKINVDWKKVSEKMEGRTARECRERCEKVLFIKDTINETDTDDMKTAKIKTRSIIDETIFSEINSVAYV